MPANPPQGPYQVGRRYVDGDKIVELVAAHAGGNAPNEVAKYLKRRPRYPRLVSRTGLANLYGVSISHVIRDVLEPGHAPDPIGVQDGRPVYDLDEAKAGAKAYKAARPLRAKRPRPAKTTAAVS
jgi:hypothetical protein